MIIIFYDITVGSIVDYEQNGEKKLSTIHIKIYSVSCYNRPIQAKLVSLVKGSSHEKVQFDFPQCYHASNNSKVVFSSEI